MLVWGSPEKCPADPVMISFGERPRGLVSDPPIYPRTLRALDFKPLKTARRIHQDDRWYVVRRGWCTMPDSMRERLVRNLKSSIGFGYFGGMGGMELCIESIAFELNKLLGHQLHVPTWSNCEYDVKKQNLLLSFDQRSGPLHLNGDLFDRLPPDVQDAIRERIPCKECLLDAKLLANKEIKAIIAETYRTRAHEIKDSHCIKCNKRCPLMPGDDSEFADRTVKIVGAGVPCTDHSNYGKREGVAGSADPSHVAWAHDMVRARYSVGFTECTVGWDAEPTAQTLSPVYYGVECILDPPIIGDVVRRRRRIATFLNREEVLHVYKTFVHYSQCS